MKKVLCIIPPYIPSYFNAGHHLPVFLVASYLRETTKMEVKAMDCAALNTTWKDICDILQNEYDFIVVMNDFDAIDSFERFLKYCREFSPTSKLITFGRLSNQIPLFFSRFGFDSIISSGDYEAGVQQAIACLEGQLSKRSGFYLRENGKYLAPECKGVYLPAEQWHLPDISEIPYPSYDRMYLNDLNKFCGIPERRELVVPIARGCPVNCSFCDVPFMQGLSERRISVERTVNYIRQAFEQQAMEYYSFYCPTFTLNRKWVNEFCERVIHEGLIYPWKCVTVAGTLTHDLVKRMAEAGCIRISLGVETLDPGAVHTLPKIKQHGGTQLEGIIQWCSEFNIEINCFVILGLPGDSLEGVYYTIHKILGFKGRVRPTIYTPYHLLREDMTVNEVNNFNRQFILNITETPNSDKQAYYKLFYDNKGDIPTNVMKQISQRGELFVQLEKTK